MYSGQIRRCTTAPEASLPGSGSLSPASKNSRGLLYLMLMSSIFYCAREGSERLPEAVNNSLFAQLPSPESNEPSPSGCFGTSPLIKGEFMVPSVEREGSRGGICLTLSSLCVSVGKSGLQPHRERHPNHLRTHEPAGNGHLEFTVETFIISLMYRYNCAQAYIIHFLDFLQMQTSLSYSI